MSREGSRDVRKICQRTSAIAGGSGSLVRRGMAHVGLNRDVQDRRGVEKVRRIQRQGHRPGTESGDAGPAKRLGRACAIALVYDRAEHSNLWERGRIICQFIKLWF